VGDLSPRARNLLVVMRNPDDTRAALGDGWHRPNAGQRRLVAVPGSGASLKLVGFPFDSAPDRVAWIGARWSHRPCPRMRCSPHPPSSPFLQVHRLGK
jgi:hypothetical protein